MGTDIILILEVLWVREGQMRNNSYSRGVSVPRRQNKGGWFRSQISPFVRGSAQLPLQEELQPHDLSNQPMSDRSDWSGNKPVIQAGREDCPRSHHPGHQSHHDRKEQCQVPERRKDEAERHSLLRASRPRAISTQTSLWFDYFIQ